MFIYIYIYICIYTDVYSLCIYLIALVWCLQYQFSDGSVFYTSKSTDFTDCTDFSPAQQFKDLPSFSSRSSLMSLACVRTYTSFISPKSV